MESNGYLDVNEVNESIYTRNGWKKNEKMLAAFDVLTESI
jgi:hypothetical protein